jgi:hypothetical protein
MGFVTFESLCTMQWTSTESAFSVARYYTRTSTEPGFWLLRYNARTNTQIAFCFAALLYTE